MGIMLKPLSPQSSMATRRWAPRRSPGGSVPSLFSIASFLAVLLCLAPSLCAQTQQAELTRIILNASHTLQASDRATPLTLAQIATLTGDQSQRLGAVVVADVSANLKGVGNVPSITITPAQVRAALDQAGVNWGRVELSGPPCQVSLPAQQRVVPTSKPDEHAAPAPPRVPELVDFSAPPTLRTRIAERIAGMFNVAPTDLRLMFEEVDLEAVSTPAAAARVDLQPATSVASGRVPMQATMYQGERVTLSRLIGVTVLVRRSVPTATRPINRGQTIAHEDFTTAEQWLPPSNKSVANADKLTGSVASNQIRAGQIISEADVGAAIACKRGDLVLIHTLSGNITIKTKARAQAQARDGELAQFKLDGSDRAFTARMSGPGRAVMVVDHSTPEPVDEATPNSNTTPPARTKPRSRTPQETRR